MTGVIEIGRKSLGCCGLAFFGIGVMLAVFHWRGAVPDASEWWKRRASGLAKTGAFSGRNQAGTWSRPVAVAADVVVNRRCNGSLPLDWAMSMFLYGCEW